MRARVIAAVLMLAGCHGGTPELAFDEAAPLSSTGSAIEGQSVFAQRDQGHCVLCHQVASLEAPFQGNIGPDLSYVGARLSPEQIRFRIIDASRLNPATTMPPYYRVQGLERVASEYEGKTVLTEQQIEHLVAYLEQLQ